MREIIAMILAGLLGFGMGRIPIVQILGVLVGFQLLFISGQPLEGLAVLIGILLAVKFNNW